MSPFTGFNLSKISREKNYCKIPHLICSAKASGANGELALSASPRVLDVLETTKGVKAEESRKVGK